MTTNPNNFDFNGAGEQRSFDVIPANTVCTLQMTIRPGGAGDGGWLKRSADGASEGLDCEFVVVDGLFAKRKLWQVYTLAGTRQGHEDAGKISRDTLRAILESARGIRPDDKSDAAQAARKVSGWQDFDQLRFVARLGVRPPTEKYAAKNTISEIVTPERQGWNKPAQIERDLLGKPQNNSAAPTPTTATCCRSFWFRSSQGLRFPAWERWASGWPMLSTAWRRSSSA
jgi:hypothetical protein